MADRTLYAAGIVAYDGTAYKGFQVQDDVATIQGELESALTKFCEPAGRVSAAGRTDAGVHASGQVIAVRVDWKHGVRKLQNAWNAHLPADISVRGLREVPDEFHARFSALARTYRYRVIHSEGTDSHWPSRSPLTDRYAWWVGEQLEVEAMQVASDMLIGEHDFATFGQPTQGESTVRSLKSAVWQVDESSVVSLDRFAGQKLVFSITANGFLRQMVRAITGTLVDVGRGRLRPDDVVRMLEGRDRALASPPAPACGLTLERVTYPETYSFE